MTAYTDFQHHIASINDLCCVINLLTWDDRTQMPPRGATMRGSQLATVTRLAQERFTSAETGRLIARAEDEVVGDPPDSYRVCFRETGFGSWPVGYLRGLCRWAIIRSARMWC
jgi:carboxypeptidase Taq